VLHGVDDTAVKYFWEVEHAKRRDELQSAAIAPLLNRLGEMFATDMLRNILGQPLNRFDFREIIDNRKILLVKLSKGTIGADNASLLGSIIIAKVYAAAMSRADLAPEERRDFYFYIDEFQNFATPSFVEILSESRKYKLNFTLANQFLGQLSADIRRTLFGNVGNLLTFRVSGEDAAILAQEFSPRFGAEDMINLGPREFYVKMTIKAVAQMGFSGRTLDLPAAPEGVEVRNKIIEFSRNHYSLPLRQARELLALWEEGVEPYQEAI
jgi:type IV secretory pathway TraG/TraD family ATPase VirD4